MQSASEAATTVLQQITRERKEEENPRDGTRTGGVHVIAPSPAPRSASAPHAPAALGSRCPDAPPLTESAGDGERRRREGVGAPTATVQPLGRRRRAIYFVFTFGSSAAPSPVTRLARSPRQSNIMFRL